MPKDRLTEFLRTAKLEEDNEKENLEISLKMPLKFKKDGEPSPPVNSLEIILCEVEEIRSNITLLQVKVKEVKKLQSSILSVPHSEIRQSLDDVMIEIKKLSKVIQKQLKELEVKIKEDESANEELIKKGEVESHQADLRMKKLQHTTLLKTFRDTMSDYSDCQVQHREQCKKRLVMTLHIAKQDVTDEEVEDFIEKGSNQIFAEHFLEQSMKAKLDLQEIEERHNELTKLEKSIQEVRDLFVDLSVIVMQQGEMIDRIEANMDQTRDYVEASVKHTQKAVQSQSKARKKKMCIIGCIVIAVLILVIIITLSIVVK